MADVKDVAIQIWTAQNELLLTHGIDVSKRTFAISGDIDEHSFAVVDAKLAILERDSEDPQPITIKLNCLGGDVYNAWAIVSRIQASPCPIYIDAYGTVMSAATMIFLAGKKRRVSRYCEFMFHQTQVSEMQGSLSQIENATKSMKREEEMYCKFLSENSKKSVQWWKKMLSLRKDIFLTAEQVIKLGIAEEIF